MTAHPPDEGEVSPSSHDSSNESTQTNFSDYADNTDADSELTNISEELCDEPAEALNEFDGEHADKNTAKLMFACSAAPSFPDEDDNGKTVMTDGGRDIALLEKIAKRDGDVDTHRVRFVEYQGEGYWIDDWSHKRLSLAQPGEYPTEVPVEECTPTNSSGNPIDTDGLILTPCSVWDEYNDPSDYPDIDEDDDGKGRLMTDGGKPDDFTRDFDTDEDGNDGDEDSEAVTDHDGIPFGPNEDDDDVDNDSDSDDSESSDDLDASEKPEGNVETDGNLGATIDSSTSPDEVSVPKPDEASENDEDSSESSDTETSATDSTDNDSDGDDGEDAWPGGESDAPTVRELRNLYRLTPGNHPKDWVRTQTMVTRFARKRACDYLEEHHEIIYVDEKSDDDEDQGLQGTYLYDEETGLFESGCAGDVETIIENLLPIASTDGEKLQILGKVQDRNKANAETLNARDRDDTYRCVNNGVLNINTWELHEHDPEFRMVTKLDAEWDTDVDTDEVLDFIGDIFPEKYVPTVIELLGDILTDHYKSQYFVMMYGPSNTGKTEFLDFIGKLLTKPNRSAQTLRDIATSQWSSAKLVSGVGVMANLADEVEGKRIENTENIKRAVGGREMSHETKGVDPFELENTGKLWNPTNNPPVINDDQKSIAKRMIPLECPHVFKSDPDPDNPFEKQKDPEIMERLDTEKNRAALLQVMAEGLDRLRSRGWNVSLEDEEPYMKRLERYHSEADTVYSFGNDCLYETSATNQYDGSRVFLKKQEVYNMYVNYCESEGSTPLDYRVFFRKLNQGGSVAYGVMDSPGKTLPGGDREPALIGVSPTKIGWDFVARPEETLGRFSAHVADDADVPMPGDDAPSGPQAQPEGFWGSLDADVAADGGRDTFVTVTRVIARLNEENASGAEELAVLQACDDDTPADVGARDVMDVLDTLMENSVVKQDDDGVYHVVEDDILDNDDEDDDDDESVERSSVETWVLQKVRNAGEEGLGINALKGNAANTQHSAEDVDSAIKSLRGDAEVYLPESDVLRAEPAGDAE